VNIEDFYDQDPRRRASDEQVFGREWSQESVRCEVAWVADTGELYVMLEPGGEVKVGVDPSVVFGALSPFNLSGVTSTTKAVPTDALTVEVLGVIERREDVERVMAGWQQAMAGANRIAWVRNRVRSGESVPE
jgi:hypothetical protein